MGSRAGMGEATARGNGVPGPMRGWRWKRRKASEKQLMVRPQRYAGSCSELGNCNEATWKWPPSDRTRVRSHDGNLLVKEQLSTDRHWTFVGSISSTSTHQAYATSLASSLSVGSLPSLANPNMETTKGSLRFVTTRSSQSLPRRLHFATSTPISSNVSRIAASSSVSPPCLRPPGNATFPLQGSPRRAARRIKSTFSFPESVSLRNNAATLARFVPWRHKAGVVAVNACDTRWRRLIDGCCWRFGRRF